MAKYKKIGTIELSDKIYVTDPCYDTDVWCQNYIISMKPGTYTCYSLTREDCIHKIKIVHTDATKNINFKNVSNIIGVDSGQAGFFNAPYYEKNQPVEEWYKRVCNTTDSDLMCGTMDNAGFVSSSGYGDGLYALEGSKDDDDKYIALKLTFVEDAI